MQVPSPRLFYRWIGQVALAIDHRAESDSSVGGSLFNVRRSSDVRSGRMKRSMRIPGFDV